MVGYFNKKTKKLLIDTTSHIGEGKFHTIKNDDKLYLNGYFLNSDKKCAEYNENNIYGLIKKIINNNPNIFQETLYGCYTVVYIDENNCCYIYNDLLSKMSIFYCIINDDIIFSNSFFDCAINAKKHGANLSIDYLALKMMKSNSIIFDDLTYFKEIKFLKPFQYICIKDEKIKICNLEMPNTDINMTETYAIDECHKLFSEGVMLSRNINKANGYRQVMTLSGGMDSRTSYLYGEKTQEKSEILYSYAEESSMDYLIPLRIAEKEKKQFFYHSLNNGQFLAKRDEIAKRVEGLHYYAGTTGLYESLSMYDKSNWGIVHTGVGGGEIMGDMCTTDNDKSWSDLEYSLTMTSKEKNRFDDIKRKYSSFNQFSNINDIRRCLASQKMAKSFGIDYDSAFLYEPFFVHMLKVPFKFKHRRKLYIKWLKKYCNYKYPSTHQYCSKIRAIYLIKRILQEVLKKLGKKSKYDMNPIVYWQKTNKKLVEDINNMFKNDIKEISNCLDKEFINSIEYDWNVSSLVEKTKILTLTWLVREIKLNSLV